MALAEIENRDDTIYVSTGGGFGPKTESAILKLAEGRETFSGFDNDTAGQALHKKQKGFLPSVTRHAPPSRIKSSEALCKDWLDALNAMASATPAPAMQSPERDQRGVGQGVPASDLDTAPEEMEKDRPDFRL